jgi:hypothetical protein
MGFSVDGSEADFRAVGRHMPFVRFVPRSERWGIPTVFKPLQTANVEAIPYTPADSAHA